MKSPTRIIGAGLSGLLAAHAWPNVPIIEASPEPEPHAALLRFRSDKVANLTGIAFKKVLVRKGLWSRGAFVAPTIALANAYSQKVVGCIIGDRSIWNLDPVERWIAPENFQERLLANVRSRVTFATMDTMDGDKPVISTAPMPIALNACNVGHRATFDRAAIRVQRYRVPRCDAHQTVYFPDWGLPLYRASITGDALIVESVTTLQHRETPLALGLKPFESQLNQAFGIDLDECTPLGQVKQEYGKIVNLPDATRRALMFELTSAHGVYSLGRFAQWRNILLDDVVDDIQTIKRLMATDRYELRKAAS